MDDELNWPSPESLQDENYNFKSDNTPKTSSNGLVGTLEDRFSNAYGNVQSNLGRTYDNFSQGNIGKGLADTGMMLHDPLGGWGSKASSGGKQSQSIPEPTFGPEHLTPPDKNGMQQLNDAGKTFLNQHMQSLSAPNTDTGIPSDEPGSNNSQYKPGLLGRTVNSLVGGGVNSAIQGML